METVTTMRFDDPQLITFLSGADAAELDQLEFGVIGFDAETLVRVYNAYESRCAALAPSRVLAQPLFTMVAPCMNNFMVAHRFEETQASGESLDEIVDYVLTLRMRPTKVKLRLLAGPNVHLRYVLVQRAI